MTDQNQAETILLTSREVRNIVAAFQCLGDGDIKLNWDKFLALSEYSTINSARTNFAGLKKKLSLATPHKYYVVSATDATMTPKPSPRKPHAKTPTKSKVDAPATDTPTKRKKHPTEDTTPLKRPKGEDAVKQEVKAEETEETPAVAEEDPDD
ncbi:MAG: hypothetical protein Q9178_003785 [Gyalolechia marmorata]